MKRFLFLLFSLFVALNSFSGSLHYSAKEFPMIHLKDSTRYVCDPFGFIDADSVRVMDSLIADLRHKKMVEVVVAVTDSVTNGDCFQYAYDIGVYNGVGQEGADNGLVILLSTGERCVQFATGLGMEGYLTDYMCVSIQKNFMNPHFAQNQWSEGLTAGVRAVCGFLKGEISEEDINRAAPKKSFWKENRRYLLEFFPVLAMLLFSFFSSRKKRCPNCKKRTAAHVDSTKIKESGAFIYYSYHYKCKNCNHEFDEESRQSKDRYNGSRSGRYGGSGGSRGGSFGGGRFGGGGGGSRF